MTTSGASSAAPAVAAPPYRILLPFAGRSLSQRALDTALQMARTENATLVPVRLERVPLHLAMDASPDHQLADALAGIQRRARDLGVHIDPRISHGRSYRHALLRTLTTERYDRVVLAAGPGSGVKFTAPDVAWVVDRADGEIVVVTAERPRRRRSNVIYYAR